MNTKRQSAIKALSERSQRVLHHLLDRQVAPESIAGMLRLQTKEDVSPAAITRYASRYRRLQQEQKQVRENIDGFIAQVHKDGITVADLLRAVLVEKLSQEQRSGTLPKKDLLDLEAAERRRGEFDLKRAQAKLSAEFRGRELAIKERQARLAERRFRFDRKKAQATFDQLARKASAGERITDDDMRLIREVYGLGTKEPVSSERTSDQWQAISAVDRKGAG